MRVLYLALRLSHFVNVTYLRREQSTNKSLIRLICGHKTDPKYVLTTYTRSHAGLLISESMTLRSSVTETSRTKHCSIARLLTVWLSVPLCVTAWGEGFVTLGTLQTGRMPVFTHRRLLLREVDLFLTSWTLRHL